METFYFSLETKVTDCYRTDIEIEAKSLEEAKELAIKFIKEGQHENESWEQIDNCIQKMSKNENNGQPTEVLFTEDFDTIWDNTQD
jgi:hypothetical protein